MNVHHFTIGDGLTNTFDVEHPLSTEDVFVQLRDTLTGEVYDRCDGYAVLVVGPCLVKVVADLVVPVDGLRVSIRV